MSSSTISAASAANAARRGNAGGRIALIIGGWLAFILFLLLPLVVPLPSLLPWLEMMLTLLPSRLM